MLNRILSYTLIVMAGMLVSMWLLAYNWMPRFFVDIPRGTFIVMSVFTLVLGWRIQKVSPSIMGRIFLDLTVGALGFLLMTFMVRADFIGVIFGDATRELFSQGMYLYVGIAGLLVCFAALLRVGKRTSREDLPESTSILGPVVERISEAS